MRIRDFGGARGGNVTLTFALALLPLVGIAGSAVDYSRGNSAKAAMQAAADATALMLSKDAANLTVHADQVEGDGLFQCQLPSHRRRRRQGHPVLYDIGRFAGRGDRDRKHTHQPSQGDRLF